MFSETAERGRWEGNNNKREAGRNITTNGE
jgi:hypothetical protein